MYTKDHRQFSITWNIPTDVATHTFDELKEIFNKHIKEFFTEDADTIIKSYLYPADKKCRFTALFPKFMSDPDKLEKIITNIIRMSIMEADILCVKGIHNDLLERVTEDCNKYNN